MVLCVVALIVFGILGIFSVKYRVLAKEAFDCVARTATLRPCQTGFDTRLKGKIVVGALKVSPGLARALNKNFHLFSVAFTLLFFRQLGVLRVLGVQLRGVWQLQRPGFFGVLRV